MKPPPTRSLYVTTCALLGGFATTLAVAAITYTAGLDYTYRAPLEIVASIVGLIGSAHLARRHLAHRGNDS